jgi:hypothetical protein
MMKSAPGRFSTITDFFQRLAKSSARVRATASGGPPAEPVMMRTVRSGQALSASAAETAGAATAIKAINESILIGIPMTILPSFSIRWRCGMHQGDASMPGRCDLRLPNAFGRVAFFLCIT